MIKFQASRLGTIGVGCSYDVMEVGAAKAVKAAIQRQNFSSEAFSFSEVEHMLSIWDIKERTV